MSIDSWRRWPRKLGTIPNYIQGIQIGFSCNHSCSVPSCDADIIYSIIGHKQGPLIAASPTDPIVDTSYCSASSSCSTVLTLTSLATGDECSLSHTCRDHPTSKMARWIHHHATTSHRQWLLLVVCPFKTISIHSYQDDFVRRSTKIFSLDSVPRRFFVTDLKLIMKGEMRYKVKWYHSLAAK